MKNLSLNNNDLFLTPGKNLALVEYPQSIAQAIECRLKTFLGEWFLDQDLGIPFFSDVLIKTDDKSKIDLIFQKEILKINGVVKIEQFASEINRETREYKIMTLDVKVSSGETIEVA